MANDSLNTPITITALGISAASLPAGLSPAYHMYVLSQAQDFTNVAGKANEAGQGAYDAQVKNEEQDLTLEDHEQRISSAEQELQDHEQRISQAESTLQNHEQRIAANELELQDHDQRIAQNEQDISALDARLDAAESDIDALQLDYVSKSAVASQTLASPLNVTTSYSVNGTQVVGVRVTGFTAATGTALKGAFNASTTFTVSATYTQAEVQAIATALIAARQRIKALEDAMRSHGLIN